MRWVLARGDTNAAPNVGSDTMSRFGATDVELSATETTDPGECGIRTMS